MIKYIQLLLFFSITIVFSQKRQQPLELKVKGDYKQEATQTLFPELWSGFQRESITSYDAAETNVGVSYIQKTSKKNKTVLTIYIYPKKYIDNQLLRDEFYTYDYALNQNSNDHVEINPLFGTLSNENF